MTAVKARLVTIIAPTGARDRIVEALAKFGARGYSISRVEGHGAHGDHRRGLIESGNLAFLVVVSEPRSLEILAWVEAELVPLDAAIAFASDVLAVPGGHF